MSKEVTSVRRMLMILNLVRSHKGAMPKDLLINKVNKRLELESGYIPVSVRTIERDISGIFDLFHIEIKYDRRKGGYCITMNSNDYSVRINELMMNFDLLNAIGDSPELSSYVLAEHHRPLYSEWLVPLVNAIRGTHKVRFEYVNYRRDNSVKCFKVLPHYLKESNQRWYLLAYDGAVMKTYAVDRIRELEVLEHECFKRNLDIDVSQLFKDCYGIWNDESMPVEDIELRYDALDGRFIKSAPIHHSQRVLVDTDEEFRISLCLRITNDFVMELLSRSRSLEVIRPQHLRERVRQVYEDALRRNS